MLVTDRYTNVIVQARVIWVKLLLISHLLLVCCSFTYEDPLFQIFIYTLCRDLACI